MRPETLDDTHPSVEMQRFLTAIVLAGGSASRKHLPLATRVQDKVRSRAKYLGWVVYKDCKWHITDKGRDAYNPKRQQ
jgi:hypothetical protein